MPRISGKYWALVVVTVLVVGLSYAAVWITERIVEGHRDRRPAAPRAAH